MIDFGEMLEALKAAAGPLGIASVLVSYLIKIYRTDFVQGLPFVPDGLKWANLTKMGQWSIIAISSVLASFLGLLAVGQPWMTALLTALAAMPASGAMAVASHKVGKAVAAPVTNRTMQKMVSLVVPYNPPPDSHRKPKLVDDA